MLRCMQWVFVILLQPGKHNGFAWLKLASFCLVDEPVERFDEKRTKPFCPFLVKPLCKGLKAMKRTKGHYFLSNLSLLGGPPAINDQR